VLELVLPGWFCIFQLELVSTFRFSFAELATIPIPPNYLSLSILA